MWRYYQQETWIPEWFRIFANPSASANLLHLLVDFARFPTFAWYGAVGAPQQMRTNRKNSGAREKDAANSIRSVPVYVSLPGTHVSFRVHRAVRQSSLLCSRDFLPAR